MVDLGIVIASYNTRDLLRSCLRSVYASRGDFTFDVCVVDNASHDGSAEMTAAGFPQARLIVNPENVGYPRANNQGLVALGFHRNPGVAPNAPRFALLLNSDAELSADGLMRMLAFMAEHPEAGIAGPKLVRPDGSLDLACRRAFPTPEVSLYRLAGLSRLVPRSKRFGRYNFTYLDADQLSEVDSVSGAFMMVRSDAIAQAGLLDEDFFMYGEDLDWAFRIRSAGWKAIYNPDVTVLHVKRASTRRSPRAQIEFYRAMDIFYRKHYAAQTPRPLHLLIVTAIALRRHLQQFKLAIAPIDKGPEVKA